MSIIGYTEAMHMAATSCYAHLPGVCTKLEHGNAVGNRDSTSNTMCACSADKNHAP